MRPQQLEHLLAEHRFLQAHQQHPACGWGLFFKLDLPVTFDEEVLPDVCRSLNLTEYSDDEAAPLLGAWCIGESNGPAFVGFVPNMLYHPQHVYRIATWLWWRSDWAKALLTGGAEA